jgi:hypothetical protein
VYATSPIIPTSHPQSSRLALASAWALALDRQRLFDHSAHPRRQFWFDPLDLWPPRQNLRVGFTFRSLWGITGAVPIPLKSKGLRGAK